ncbi:MAG: DUF1080 domain-containing protein [Planctomycetales bacterium]|nr:DUF1080 domain-containing protein [Planctomycetales bacterium]
MRSLLLLTLLTLISNSSTAAEDAAPNQLTPEQIRDGWISLFDGETLFGWQPTSDVDWQVADGEIRATQGKMGILATTSQFADYQLHVEFKAGSATNSGVFLHTAFPPTDAAKDCYELNIAPSSHSFPTASFVERKKVDTVDPAPDQWHSYDVTIVGNKISVLLDGKPAVEYVDAEPLLRGRVGLQFNEGPIAFRNVRLKPLGAESIFNGRDLEGWNIDRAEQSQFGVSSNRELRVINGKGQIESDGRYGNFILQLECFVDGDALNSGVFFRCIPGDMMMGYESQIHNGMKDGDPTQPLDCGTGGIFRRQNARRIVAKDHEWFSKTLIADGPHIAAWVNGYQVSDWTDDRKPHENPRKGLRLEPGTLAIQGHDPTTNLRFRNLRIAELPE